MGTIAQTVDSTALIIRERLDSIVAAHPVLMERTQLGLYVYDLTADTALYARGYRQQMRPASTQKVMTAVAALRSLGGNYRLRTRLSMGDDVIVHGGMDPRFGAEDMAAFADSVKAQGRDTIPGRLVLDLTKKDGNRMGWGWCWDDDTRPLTPLTYNGRDTFAKEFLAALAARGVVVMGAACEALTPVALDTLTIDHQPAHLICERTASIDQILGRMLKRSDNQYAESLYYQLGYDTKSASRKVMDMLVAAGADCRQLQVADGSGLSLYNYTTPETLVLTLRYAFRNEKIYRHLMPALPLAGYDGTLRRRMKSGAAHENVRAKTGSLDGVSTLAGYATAPNGHLLAFAIMNQGIRHSSSAHEFQDAVCQALCSPTIYSDVEQDELPPHAEPDEEAEDTSLP